MDYDQASSLANFPVDRRTSGQSDASFRGPPRGATQSPQLDVYGAYSDHNSMYSDSFRAAPNPYYVDQPQQTHSMATQDSSGPDPYGGLSADQMTDYYATPDLMQPPASPAFPPGPGSYDATFSAPAQQQPHYPGQSALFPPATDQPIPQQFYPPQQQVHGLAPPMPPMPFPGPAGFPSGIPPPHLQRAMSSASSMNIGPYNSSIASSSAVNLNSMQPMPQPSERKRTLSTRSTDDRSRPPITKAAIDEYRNRIKADPDPETQFNFAKYLIEAARKLGQASSKSTAEHEVKALKRYRDSLLQESLKTMKKLATQGTAGKPAYADAQFFYANLLSSGSLGLSVDLEKAYGLYVQASKQNHPAATYRTAFCNEGGLGTKKDYNRAVLFYRKASALGDPVGMFRLGMILLQGLLQQQRNGKEAVTWLNRAAQQADESNPQPLHELASLYERPPDPRSDVGPTVPPDDGMAVELYTQAGKLGYAPSQHKLGGIYEFGALGCPVDPRKSIAWYTRAVERGYGPAELALSGWYLTGEGIARLCVC